MSPAVVRDVEIQRTLKDSSLGLRAHEAPNSSSPLKFDLVSSALQLEKEDMDACIDLVESTSSHDYKASSIGWNPRRKRAEMTDREMIYLLVRQGDVDAGTEHKRRDDAGTTDQATPQIDTSSAAIDNTESVTVSKECIQNKCEANNRSERPHSSSILGFISFMFTNDDPPHDDREVVYIYEIHLREHLRGRGLGSNLIQFVEEVATRCGVTKTMLTVFTANRGARTMYEKLGYGRDECSPKDRVTRRKVIEAEYVIMSKELR